MSKVRGQKKQQKIVESNSDSEFDSDEGDLVIGGKDEFESGTKVDKDAGQRKKVTSNIVHLHFQQRTTRKCWTIVQGLPEDLDFKKIVRHFKKAFVCNGSIAESEEQGTIIQLQGDHRRQIHQFLCEEGMANKETIKIHGY